MRGSGILVAVLALVFVVVAAQVAFTDVGREVGADLSAPVEVTSTPASQDSGITSVAVASPSSGTDPGSGAGLAWIKRTGDQWRVQYAPLTISDGAVSVGDPVTVATSKSELGGLDLAAGPRPVLVWERQASNEVVLASPGGDGARVVSNDSLRVDAPSVAVVEGTPVVAWQAYRDGGYRVVATVADGADGSGDIQRVGSLVAGRESPRVTATGDRVAITWVDPNGDQVLLRQGTLDGRLSLQPQRTLGTARPLGGFGGGQGAVSMGAASSQDGVRVIWTDLGVVTVGGTGWDGTVTAPVQLGRGNRPGIATQGDDWLAAWLVSGTASGTDVDFAAGTGGAVTARGPASRLASSANSPRPIAAPDLGLVWTERGTQSRVLVSAYTPGGEVGTIERLTRSGGRFAFIGLGSAVVAGITVVVLPWTFFAYLIAFLATTRIALDKVTLVLSWLSRNVGDGRSRGAIESQLRVVPVGTWVALFVVMETGLLLVLMPASVQSTTISFTHPLGVSVLAALGTIPVLLALDVDSAWHGSVVFAYLQSAALWTTALPAVM